MLKRFCQAALLAVIGVLSTMCTRPALSQERWSFDSEVLFLQLNTAAGTRANDVFGFDTAQRFSAAFNSRNNVALRFKYFTYDEQGTDPGFSTVLLDIYNADLEIVKKLNLTNMTSFEFSGGIRYTDADTFFPTAAEPNDFTGFGGIVGIKGTTRVFTGGDVYARGAFALLTGTAEHDSNRSPNGFVNEASRTHMELGMGYQHTFQLRRLTIVPHGGVEWLNLSDYAVDLVDEHPESDMMLAGFSFGITARF